MQKEKLINIYETGYHYLHKFIYLLLPIITCVIFLIICNNNNLYPFGDKSIAWCDMNQQVIPLLSDFKDVLEGKQGFTYNLANAGGMSLFSVFFFFLSSPFSFLVVFVEKADLTLFMNLLVMFKLMVASLTMGLYLQKKYKDLNVLFIISLSLLYTFSVYSMMYYQNIMWLDILYLFPLLMLSLDYLLEKNKFIPYLIVISLIVIVNYYISFMVICFTLLYMGLQFYFRRKEEGINKKAQSFVVASIIGALLCCFSIIPSFIQYMESARSSSLEENIGSSWFITHYQTALPLLFGTIILIPFLFKKEVTDNRKINYILLIIMCIPLIIDPINKMWHMGSYQAFPCRFAFINIFLILDIFAINLNETKEENFSLKHIIGLSLSIFLLIAVYIFENDYISKKLQDLDQYSHSLWGNTTSFEALLRYYSIILIIVLGIYTLFKAKLINKKILSLSLINLTIVEIIFSTNVYMIAPSRTTENYQEIYSLQESINDDSFYRVKMSHKMFDVNALGGAGFNNLGHYTSLTNEDYMFTMKKLGYSSYWMEVGPYGGTTFTDALLQNKYTLNYGINTESKYHSEHYYFTENKILPFGLITTSDLSNFDVLQEDTRPNMQENLYKALFNDGSSLHTIYEPTSYNNVNVTSENNRYQYNSSGGTITYNININGTQTLYFEAFDVYSNSLGEKINDKISITCNGKYISSYPSQSMNGSLYLGEYNNTNIIVKVTIKENINVSSLNVFSVNEDLLDKQIRTAKSASIKVYPDKIEGNYYAEEESYLFLPLSYFDGANAKINNQNVKVEKVFSSFMAIKLNKGENNILITYSQPGLGIGIILSILGGALLAAYIYFKDRLSILKNDKKIMYYTTLVLSISVFFILYILPIIMNIYYQLK